MLFVFAVVIGYTRRLNIEDNLLTREFNTRNNHCFLVYL
jgi:hypothetical protein